MGIAGLLLGAGASFEAGMPLAWELTKELKNWLTPEKLRSLNDGWLEQGGGYSDVTIDDLARVLVIEGMNYEHITGYLEVQRERQRARSHEYYGLLAFLSEIIYFLLREKHVLNADYIERNIRCLDGIKTFVEKNKPLWVFSLNHDLIVECLSADVGIPLKCGFGVETIRLPWRDINGAKTGETKARVTRREHFVNNALNFHQNGEEGINLLKIHGSLDEFAFNDGQDLLKIVPNDNTVSGVIAELRRVNDEVRYVDPRWPGGVVKAANEIAYEDGGGIMQFLRRTPLVGAFKFQGQSRQTVPSELLSFFILRLNYLSSLVSIGYSFGDQHVNQGVRGWLEGNDARRLTIVDPGADRVPTPFLHLSPQIDLVRLQATDFLDREAGISRTRQEMLDREFGAWVRGKSREEAALVMNQYMDQLTTSAADRMVEWVKTLPFRDGDIDLAELGLTTEEFLDIALARSSIPSPEEALEEFLRQATSSD